MSKIKINVEVKEGKETLRAFTGLEVNLFDTAKENIEHYSEELLHLCFIGTSGKVNIQNKVRSYASDMDKDGKYVNDDAAVKKFAEGLDVTVGLGSELQSEKASIMASMDAKALEAHNAAMAYAEQFNKQASGNVKTRKDEKTAEKS
jgi:hypothetical protein